jgi:hypothetical protein
MPIVWALGNAGFKPRLKVSRWCVSDPLARFARVSPHEGEINACKASFVLPLVRGRAAEGGRGSFYTPSRIVATFCRRYAAGGSMRFIRVIRGYKFL